MRKFKYRIKLYGISHFHQLYEMKTMPTVLIYVRANPDKVFSLEEEAFEACLVIYVKIEIKKHLSIFLTN